MEGEKISSTLFRWKINNFSKVCSKKLTGVFSKKKLTTESFEIGGQTWRLIIYPKGIKKGKYLSIYLESTLPPAGLARNVKFILSVINQIDSAKTIKREARHEFTASSRASGIPEMLSLDELIRADEGFLVNDTIIVEVDIPEGATFAKYRTWLSDIQNLLKEKTCEKEASSSSQEIDDVADVIETEQKIELRKAFSTMSRVSDREKEAVSPVTKFIAEFNQTCEQYAVAQEDIEAAKEKEKIVGERTTILKLVVDMMDPLRERVVDTMDPLRERAKKIEREIDEHKRILQVKEARKARIMEFLESLSVTLRRSQPLLDEANQNLKQFMPKTEEAQNKMDDTEKLWESLKSHFKHLF